MTRLRQSLGLEGEDLAARHLAAAGMRILDRRARTPCGEIDLVARDGDAYVFVEVKARSSRRFGLPEEAVDARRRARLARAARAWLRGRGLGEVRMRFDVVALEAGELRHLRGAFDAPRGSGL